MKESSFGPLIDALLDGDHAKAVAEVRELCTAGVDPQMIVTAGIEKAMSRLDEKCTVEHFNLLEIMPGLGVDIANFDYEVDPLAAQKALPHTCLDGNLKSLSFVTGSPAEIGQQSRELLGFILSSGCEIPPEARPENVAAMVAAVRQQG